MTTYKYRFMDGTYLEIIEQDLSESMLKELVTVHGIVIGRFVEREINPLY